MAALTRRGAGRLPSAGFALGGCGSRRSYLANFGGVDLRRTFQHQKVVRYPVSTIYNAVASVDEYSEFLPWCLSSRVLARKSNAASDDGSPTPAEEKLKTEIEVGIASLSAQFGSTVTLLPNERVHAVSEPNKYLENLIFTWQFAPIGEQACRIDLQLDFALRSAEHVLMWDMMKDRVVAEYLNCFQRRCAQLKAKSAR